MKLLRIQVSVFSCVVILYIYIYMFLGQTLDEEVTSEETVFDKSALQRIMQTNQDLLDLVTYIVTWQSHTLTAMLYE